MKTTSGKTKTRRPKRSMRIHSADTGSRLQVRYGSSLKQGLEEFFKEVLKPKGHKRVSCFGNQLMTEKDGETFNYVAYEEVSGK